MRSSTLSNLPSCCNSPFLPSSSFSYHFLSESHFLSFLSFISFFSSLFLVSHSLQPTSPSPLTFFSPFSFIFNHLFFIFPLSSLATQPPSPLPLRTSTTSSLSSILFSLSPFFPPFSPSTFFPLLTSLTILTYFFFFPILYYMETRGFL